MLENLINTHVNMMHYGENVASCFNGFLKSLQDQFQVDETNYTKIEVLKLQVVVLQRIMYQTIS